VHGAIGIPPNPKTVAYWTGGVIPGQQGVAILDGHLDWYGVPCAVFCHLGNLNQGNTITIKLSNNSIETWRVSTISTVQNGDVPAFMLQHTGPPIMVLITCAGDWNAAAKSYTQRLLVTAQLVDVRGKL
jgi:LPXTG-site transpeptidase (sortase) family protein